MNQDHKEDVYNFKKQEQKSSDISKELKLRIQELKDKIRVLKEKERQWMESVTNDNDLQDELAVSKDQGFTHNEGIQEKMRIQEREDEIGELKNCEIQPRDKEEGMLIESGHESVGRKQESRGFEVTEEAKVKKMTQEGHGVIIKPGQDKVRRDAAVEKETDPLKKLNRDQEQEKVVANMDTIIVQKLQEETSFFKQPSEEKIWRNIVVKEDIKRSQNQDEEVEVLQKINQRLEHRDTMASEEPEMNQLMLAEVGGHEMLDNKQEREDKIDTEYNMVVQNPQECIRFERNVSLEQEWSGKEAKMIQKSQEELGTHESLCQEQHWTDNMFYKQTKVDNTFQEECNNYEKHEWGHRSNEVSGKVKCIQCPQKEFGFSKEQEWRRQSHLIDNSTVIQELQNTIYFLNEEVIRRDAEIFENIKVIQELQNAIYFLSMDIWKKDMEVNEHMKMNRKLEEEICILNVEVCRKGHEVNESLEMKEELQAENYHLKESEVGCGAEMVDKVRRNQEISHSIKEMEQTGIAMVDNYITKTQEQRETDFFLKEHTWKKDTNVSENTEMIQKMQNAIFFLNEEVWKRDVEICENVKMIQNLQNAVYFLNFMMLRRDAEINENIRMNQALEENVCFLNVEVCKRDSSIWKNAEKNRELQVENCIVKKLKESKAIEKMSTVHQKAKSEEKTGQDIKSSEFQDQISVSVAPLQKKAIHFKENNAINELQKEILDLKEQMAQELKNAISFLNMDICMEKTGSHRGEMESQDSKNESPPRQDVVVDSDLVVNTNVQQAIPVDKQKNHSVQIQTKLLMNGDLVEQKWIRDTEIGEHSPVNCNLQETPVFNPQEQCIELEFSGINNENQKPQEDICVAVEMEGAFLKINLDVQEEIPFLNENQLSRKQLDQDNINDSSSREEENSVLKEDEMMTNTDISENTVEDLQVQKKMFLLDVEEQSKEEKANQDNINSSKEMQGEISVLSNQKEKDDICFSQNELVSLEKTFRINELDQTKDGNMIRNDMMTKQGSQEEINILDDKKHTPDADLSENEKEDLVVQVERFIINEQDHAKEDVIQNNVMTNQGLQEEIKALDDQKQMTKADLSENIKEDLVAQEETFIINEQNQTKEHMIQDNVMTNQGSQEEINVFDDQKQMAEVGLSDNIKEDLVVREETFLFNEEDQRKEDKMYDNVVANQEPQVNIYADNDQVNKVDTNFGESKKTEEETFVLNEQDQRKEEEAIQGNINTSKGIQGEVCVLNDQQKMEDILSSLDKSVNPKAQEKISSPH
ncbi:trichohyalin-like [Polypterus senegalus]|uniref:trichohyalin-like n=1 Tax=Polypterus senegalus TaxID=55291 RepID=UPI00196626C2|nr:trichohyalin-like [Polypterus senegalus]